LVGGFEVEWKSAQRPSDLRPLLRELLRDRYISAIEILKFDSHRDVAKRRVGQSDGLHIR
jgi:hypothetical protein